MVAHGTAGHACVCRIIRFKQESHGKGMAVASPMSSGMYSALQRYFADQ